MVLKLSHLRFSYDERKMFEDFSMEVEPKEHVALLGDSGSGKTTLVRLMLGLLAPKTGHVECTSQVSVDFQENRLLEHFRVYDNIACTRRIGLKELDKVCREFRLPSVAEQKVEELSGGMKRRVALMRALLYPAQLYILDESVREVDEETRDAMLSRIRHYTANHALIYITHDRRELEQLEIHRILRLKRREDGTITLELE